MNQETSCGCIIINDKKVLVISTVDDDGKIFSSFPKGHQEPGETNEQTALREVREEVGLDVEITDETPIITSHPVKQNTALKTIYLFLAKPKDPSQALKLQDEEVETAKWLAFAEADKALSGKYCYYGDCWQEAKSRLEKSS